MELFSIRIQRTFQLVSTVLGHTKITTTQHYAKITTEKLDKDFSMLESKISDRMKLV